MTNKKFPIIIQFTIECPYCGKEVNSYGDAVCYCRECEVGFQVEIYNANHQKLSENKVKWWFGDKITENQTIEEFNNE